MMAIETLDLHAGEAIDLQIENDTLVIRRGRPVYRLDERVETAQRQCPPPALDDTPTGCKVL